MIYFLSNAFNDPSNPWYYVLGVFFLLLVFGALAAYVVWDGKRKKKSKSEHKPEETEQVAPEQTITVADAETQTQTDAADNSDIKSISTDTTDNN